MNRGNTKVGDLVGACRKADFTDVVVVQETRGEPDALIVSHLPFGPTLWFTLSGCVMRHDIEDRGHVSEQAPHLIFHNFSTPLGKRVQTALTHLFPVPRLDASRVLTFSNSKDFISFRHHNFRDERKRAGAASEEDRGGAATGGAAAGGEGEPPADAGSSAGKGSKGIELVEVGPRFEMMLFQVSLGTIEQEGADVEWVLRPYMNTARKRRAL